MCCLSLTLSLPFPSPCSTLWSAQVSVDSEYVVVPYFPPLKIDCKFGFRRQRQGSLHAAILFKTIVSEHAATREFENLSRSSVERCKMKNSAMVELSLFTVKSLGSLRWNERCPRMNSEHRLTYERQIPISRES